MARPEKRSIQGKESGHCESSDYAPPTPLLKSWYLDHLGQLDQFSSRKRNQYHSSSTTETPDTQSSQENHKNVTEIPSRFCGLVTYDEELWACVFADTNARGPAEGCMYIILHGPTRRSFRYNLTVDQFNLTNTKDHNWTTQYILCKDYIFHQMTDQNNYVKQTKAGLK